MFAPLLFSFLGALTAAVMAYGVDASWASHSWGLSLIMMSRRLQWPMIALSLICCLALLGLVISGKRRVWWLIGLAPVLALFAHRFVTNPINRLAIVDEPQFVTADQATMVKPEDLVVGIVFDDQAYAYPFAFLERSPVVVQTDRLHRMLLMWSSGATVATALEVNRETKAGDLDIVSNPQGGLLIYNGRTGQFIASVTGNTPHGEVPTNVERRLSVTKTTWRQWQADQPETRVMLPVNGGTSGPTQGGKLATSTIILIDANHPLEINADQVGTEPQNLSANGYDVLVFRDPTHGRLHAFDRHLDKDLVPHFELNHDRTHKRAVFVDSDTNSGWSLDGRCVGGDPQFKGKRLTPLDVQEGVNLNYVRYWYKNLAIATASTQPTNPSAKTESETPSRESHTTRPAPQRPRTRRPKPAR